MPTGAVVAIGISAGGPATLHQMIPALPKRFPPVLIAQHMPADFTGPFAKRVDQGVADLPGHGR
ncbi:MAG: chemotaxis protein CheB [Phycisphaerae bacterium]